MKRFLSALFAAVLLLTMLPFGAFAAEDESSERDKLIAQACAVFPEYASAIRGETASANSLPQSSDCNEKIFEEHREISETAGMSITGYRSGDVYITHYALDGYELTYSTSNVSSSVSGVRGFVSFEATCSNAGGLFKLKNVQFQIQYNGSDYFMSYGTPYYDDTTTQINEDYVSLSASRIYYPITFNANAAGHAHAEADFAVTFSNDKVYAFLGA